ncbi:hypothetical protein M422DRAFT_778565 [Sphaerobolus stellatus SS14]|uniref:Unplaced genomic scaffold SPHSTscaffold_34, whole genome shotgun sequence n=1 Tax=Sphaerobolus stellatus (strain SS14) TaxID=990650 RepID=A0A0C9VTS4_SPHS4|nr:hypothetical protein M422DRAFT_778565 [Sphaerobolus stellatus SS14]
MANIPYLEAVQKLANMNPYYNWIYEYLKTGETYSSDTKTQRHGTCVVIADFNSTMDGRPSQLKIIPISTSRDDRILCEHLAVRPSNSSLRFVAIWCTSGVDNTARSRQVFRTDQTSKSHSPPQKHQPLVTRAILPITFGDQQITQPIPGYSAHLHNPLVLSLVGQLLDVHPAVFMEHLYTGSHLRETYCSAFFQGRREDTTFGISPERIMRIGVNERNHMTFVWSKGIALMLVSEDNALGIDFSDQAFSHHQPLLRGGIQRPVTGTILDTMIQTLKTFGSSEYSSPWATRYALIGVYSNYLARMFSSHLDLCRDQWSLYERLSKRSVLFGNALDREILRIILQDYATSYRYILRSFRTLEAIPGSERTDHLDMAMVEFHRFQTEVEFLRSCFDEFMTSQLDKSALQDSRESRTEAQQLKTLSYLGFVFLPISLATSVYGMNLKVLGSGNTSLGTFIITTVVLLGASLGILLLSHISWFPLLQYIRQYISTYYRRAPVLVTDIESSAQNFYTVATVEQQSSAFRYEPNSHLPDISTRHVTNPTWMPLVSTQRFNPEGALQVISTQSESNRPNAPRVPAQRSNPLRAPIQYRPNQPNPPREPTKYGPNPPNPPRAPVFFSQRVPARTPMYSGAGVYPSEPELQRPVGVQSLQ